MDTSSPRRTSRSMPRLASVPLRYCFTRPRTRIAVRASSAGVRSLAAGSLSTTGWSTSLITVVLKGFDFSTQLHEIHRRPYRRQRTVAVGGDFILATDLAALAEIPHFGRLPNYSADFGRLVNFAQAHLRSATMQTDEGAGKLNGAVGAHIDQVRS